MKNKPADILPQSLSPRGLSREQAAAYVGISPSLFDALVKYGRMPVPKRINSRTIWNRLQLVLLRHKRRRFVCLIGRMQQGQRERFRTMATISLRRIVAIEFGM